MQPLKRSITVSAFEEDLNHQERADSDNIAPAQDANTPAHAASSLFGTGTSTEYPEDGATSLPAELLLRALWPTQRCHHQVGVLHNKTGQFRNESTIGIPAAAQYTRDQSTAGNDTYLALAEYRDYKTRTADNAVSAAAFWLDIDCGPEKAASGRGYENPDEASKALHVFGTRAKLPRPTHVVHSGGGLHVYWAVDQPIEREVWQAHARKLKEVAKACQFLADPSRTADIASVLRMPGTLNYKYDPPRPVRLVTAEDKPIEQTVMLAAISIAHVSLCEVPAGLKVVHDVARVIDASEAPDLVRLASALKWLDPDCDDATWKLGRLAPMAGAAREHPQLADQLSALGRSWSSGELRGKPSTAWATPGASNGKTGEAVFDSAWDRFLRGDYGGTPCTLATIYHDAAQAGWQDSSDGFQVLDTPTVVVGAEADRAKEIADALLARVKGGDVGAPLERDNVAALSLLKARDPAEYHRVRAGLKAANNAVPLGEIDKAVKASMAEKKAAPTHHGYATDTINRLTVDQWRPVAHEGVLFVVEPGTNIWVPLEQSKVATMVAQAHDGKENCTRRSDYTGIAQHASDLVADTTYFAAADVGLACPDGFYRIVGNQTLVEPLTPAHRQRVLVAFSPRAQATPLFDAFLHETFQCDRAGEEIEQIVLLQEIAGGIMLGLMQRHQKAVLFYDPYGRAGKGTTERILRALVPATFVTAVSPFNWSQEYYLVQLAGARLNVVGEMPEDKPLPSAEFKTLIGGDLVTGRNPAGRPVAFKNGAAHVFMSNHLIYTRDQSDAFFARWLIVEFPNSRLLSGRPIDPDLANRIIADELSGIANWALEGAARLLRNNVFSKSAAHDRLIQKWRRSNSSLEEFINECCDLNSEHSVRKATFYERYKDWCGNNGRKAFAKSNVKEMLTHNASLGITLASLGGYEIFRGLQLKAEDQENAHSFEKTY